MNRTHKLTDDSGEDARLRVVGYSRVSSDDQVDGLSLDVQDQMIGDRCRKEKNWDLLKIYRDDGRSAWQGNFDKRPEFNRMRKDAEEGKFDIIVVAHSDRLGRSGSGSMSVADYLLTLGIRYVSIQDPVDLLNPSGKLQFAIVAMINEYNSSRTSQNVLGIVEKKRAMGAPWGKAPYGFVHCGDICKQNGADHLEWHPHPEKSSNVARIFELYGGGATMAGISRWANEHGYLTNGAKPDFAGTDDVVGGPFTSGAISHMLRNPNYVGKIRDPKAEGGWRIARFDPIVDQELFDRVQDRLNLNRRTRRTAGRRHKEPQMLKGIVRCYMCQASYGVSRQGKSGKYYLRRKRAARGGNCSCNGKSFSSKHVEDDLNDLFSGFALQEDWLTHVENSLLAGSEAAAVAHERKRVEAQIRRTDVSYREAGVLDDDAFKSEMARLKTRLKSLHIPEFDAAVAACETLAEFGMIWKEATIAEKNDLLKTSLEFVAVDHKTKRVHSILPKPEFATGFRAAAERSEVWLEELPDGEGRKFNDQGGHVVEFPTPAYPLRIVFAAERHFLFKPENLRTRREEWGMPRTELGERLGVSAGIIASWETGKGTPSIESWRSLASWFAEVPPRWATAETDNHNLGDLVKVHRQAWEMTQAELGEHLEVSVAAIGSWEGGSSPSIHNIRRLSEWLAEKPPTRRAREEVDVELGRRIQQKRLKTAMSQRALARHLGIDKNLIRYWENGFHSPSKPYAEMLEKWLSEPADGILAQRIREKRAALGMTRKDLAAVLDVSLVTIKFWENRRSHPSSKHLVQVIRWLSRGHIYRRIPEKQPEFSLFVLPMKEKRERLGIGTMTLALHLGVGKNRVFEWEAGRSIPSEAGCRKINNWLEAA